MTNDGMRLITSKAGFSDCMKAQVAARDVLLACVVRRDCRRGGDLGVWRSDDFVPCTKRESGSRSNGRI